ncbi:ppdK, partial [Symbiodinium microadriaticum]
MMDTVLNVGINDGCVLAITECTGNRRFALDLHRRFLQMFGTTVLKVSHQEYESRLADAMSRDGVDSDTQLSTDSLIYLIGEFKSLSPVPEDPHVQLLMVVEEMGAAVMVQAMVYGNRNREGDDIAHTAQAPAPIQDLRFTNAHALEQIAHFLALLENNYRDAQLIEFTIDDVRIAVDMVKCKLLSEREAIMKVDPLQMVYFLSPMIDPVHTYANVDVLGIGSKSSAGAVSGKAVFTTDDAKELRNMGVTNVLILDDLFPADVDDLNYADAVLVMHGGVTSPAAEMARGLIIPAVTALHGCGMAVNVRKHCVEKDGDVSINRHDDITVDGSNGRVIRGVVPTVQAGMDNNFLTIMKWAQKYKKMGVFCTAKNLDEATKALDLGADGLGMYRTETVLTKAANRDLLLGILLGATKMDREKYLELMEDELCTEIQAVFHMFEGKEVSIRLLDPSLNQLGILYPELVEMQTRAILRAAVKVKQSGDASPRVQLLVPMVSTDHEIEDIAPVIKSAAAEVYVLTLTGKYDPEYSRQFFSSADEVVSFVIGSSLDVPRACMRANAIAGEGDVAFLSINTDLLTELTYGMSRHDSSRLIDSYTRIGIMKRDPFISLDRNGVGSLLKIAKNLIR